MTNTGIDYQIKSAIFHVLVIQNNSVQLITESDS